MLLVSEAVLLPGADAAAPGWVEISGERITATGLGAPARTDGVRVAGTLVPGFVDVHAHGGGGASFVTLDPAEVETALAAHAAAGTTTMIDIGNLGGSQISPWKIRNDSPMP